MTHDDVLYRFRLRRFALAEELGDVRAACRILGVHPSTSDRWRKPVQRWGLIAGHQAPPEPPAAAPPAAHRPTSLELPNCGRSHRRDEPHPSLHLGKRTA